MKIFLPVLIIGIFSIKAQAQYPKHIIQLRDKGNNTFSINNPSAYLSARAISRRTRFNIPIDSVDLPVTSRYIDSIRLSGNVTILSTSRWLNQVLIQTTDQNALNKIRSFSFVRSATGIGFRTIIDSTKRERFVEEIQQINAPSQTSRTAVDHFSYGNSYNQVHIHEGEFLHNRGYRGENIQISVLDAGFLNYRSISAFDSLRLNAQVLGERDFVAFDNSVNEDDSHGMYCLSILSANWPGRMVGTAPKANYWLLRTENAASEYPIEEHNWVVGAEFADSTGSDMISSSLGYYDFDDPSFNHTYADFYKNATPVTRGATIAARKGIIVMNSAGNEGNSAWKYIGFPADADSVCAVGAVNSAGVIAGFSSYGYPGKVKPNIVSVGVGTVIAGLNNQPSSGNGTSFSNPNVAGLIACLWQAFPAFNNMKILDAVYKSSDRYTGPNDRYGFGIPNFKTAYRLLKADQNKALYGNEWFFASPNPFTTQIEVKFIGRIDGTAKVDVVNSAGTVVATQTFTTELQEIYTHTFTGLASLQAGPYTVVYTDNRTTTSVALQKGSMFDNDWLRAVPNPFRNLLVVNLKSPEAGKIQLRLVDVLGRTIETHQFNTTVNEIKTIQFATAAKLGKGAYLLQYISPSQKRVTKLLRL
ncbi:MAG: family serine peptidase [Segetibacter sp.]|nr:family serine peptidase [Segetibacter sp.]